MPLPGRQFDGVNMDRNQPVEGFPIDPTKKYRMLGQAGYDSLQEHGQLLPRNRTKYGSKVYFGDAPLKRYGARRANVDYIAEVSAEHTTPAAGAYHVQNQPLMRSDVVVHQLNRRTGEFKRLG